MKTGSTGQSAAAADFTSVTELSGDEVTRQQVASATQRYRWAQTFCRDKDVLEVACGSGMGLGLVAAVARSVAAGDVTPSLVARARAQFADRIPISVMDAEVLPFADRSLDVVLMFEALYYLPHPERFIAECQRVLRPGGVVLVTNSNKDMPDFNPSPFAKQYHGVVELGQLFGAAGFKTDFFGYWTYEAAPAFQRALLPVKKALVATGLMPKTMNGKKLLKRLVFGQLVPMPAELQESDGAYTPPEPITAGEPARRHRVVYCAATKP